MELLVAFIMVGLFVGAYIITYLVNNKVAAPEIDIDVSGCSACQSKACGHNPANKQ